MNIATQIRNSNSLKSLNAAKSLIHAKTGAKGKTRNRWRKLFKMRLTTVQAKLAQKKGKAKAKVKA